MLIHREDYLKTGLGKTQRETTTATEEINNREGKRHLPFSPLSVWGHGTPLLLRPHMAMAPGPGEAVHWQKAVSPVAVATAPHRCASACLRPRLQRE